MANKENLSPHTNAARQLRNDSSTPPAIASGSRAWQQSSTGSPSPGLLTPSSKPALRQQRDHSACRMQNSPSSPLRVRKTRENLKQASIYADIPPPCVHGLYSKGYTPPASKEVALPKPDPPFARAHDDISDTSGSTLVDDASQYPVPRPLTPMGPSQPGGLLRHRSISRRVLSRVKEGISQRSRSSHSTRTVDQDGSSLARRFSGKRKQPSQEEQSRARSFEVSRDSIDSQADVSVGQRSFTDSSVSTEELMGSGFATPPPQIRYVTPAHTRQFSGRLLSPAHSPSAEPTPRASARDVAFSVGPNSQPIQVTVPYVDLSVVHDRESLDVGRSRDIWVAVEGTVRTRVVESNSMQPPRENMLRRSPMDAIIIVNQEALETTTKSAHKLIVELCSRLNVAGDRLAVLCAKVQHVDAETVRCDCDELHALRTPSLTRLFERLSIAPSTVDTIFEEDWKSLPAVLQALSARGLRRDLVQTFIISRTPDLIVPLVEKLVQWPTHAFKIGVSPEHSTSTLPPNVHNWALEIHDDEDDIVDLLDNMIRDLRHGCYVGCVPSLRLCYKPLRGSSIVEVLGQKALKSLHLGQRCSLFLKVRIPHVDTSRASLPKDDIDQDSLFAELESIVGTLETEFLHVEARYRNTVLPGDHVVTVRQICSMRRPKTDSRWSVTNLDTGAFAADRVYAKLARFLAANYSPSRALRMIDRWAVRKSSPPSNAIQDIQQILQAQVDNDTTNSVLTTSASTSRSSPSNRPAVTIITTEVDSPDAHSVDNFSTTPCTPITDAPPRGASVSSLNNRQHDSTLQNSLLSTSTMPPTRTISAPRTTTAITISSAPTVTSTDAEDTAREVWRQIRRSSLSAKQLSEITSENLQLLEAGDGMLKAVRQQALLNKRSIGAGTLRDLKWENIRGSGHGEAPWL